MFRDLPESARVLPSLKGLKVCSEGEQTAFATSFYHIGQLSQSFCYPQGWDLFFLFFLFFLYSYSSKLLFQKKKKCKRYTKN